jgi:hypothetical protein
MVTRYVSRLEKIGAPPWTVCLGVAVLALILAGNLPLITFRWAPHGAGLVYAVLALLRILALGALVLPGCLWSAAVSRK